jgi:iron(III) transport system substrate-binding protein
MLYTGVPAVELEDLAKGFKAKYGLEIEYWRATGMEPVQRILREYQANNLAMDVFWTNDPAVYAVSAEKVLTPFISIHDASYPKELRISNDTYPTYINYWMWGYNTTMIKPEEIPKSYEDLLNPKWKDKMSIARYSDWVATLWGQWGEAKAKEYFTKLGRQNLMVHDGFAETVQSIGTGERPLTLSLTSGTLLGWRKKGAPIDGYFPDDITVTRGASIGWNSKGRNPEGGLLLIEYILAPDGGQALARTYARVPAHKDVLPNPPWMKADKFVNVNYASYLPNQTEWDRRFDELFLKNR